MDTNYPHLTQRRALADDKDSESHGISNDHGDGDDFRDPGHSIEASEDDTGTSNDEIAIAPVTVDFDKMCNDRTDDQGTCTIKGGIINVAKDSVYKNDKIVSLVFNQTKLTCVNGD